MQLNNSKNIIFFLSNNFGDNYVVCILQFPYFIALNLFSRVHVYLLCYVCIAVFTLDAGLLARIQYSEGPTTGHLDTGFSWFPCL